MNPLELEERENQDVFDFILKGVDKIHDGKKVEILDLVPELKGIGDKSYSLFTHPGNPETAMDHPITNIGNVLATNMSEYIIFPLELLNTKNDFKYFNGLSNGCGLNFEDFLEHIRNGEIKPVLTCSPKEYDYSKNIRKCFYKDIFDACAIQDYTPPYSSWRVVRLFEELKLAKVADESGISIDNGWGDEVREKHPEYSMTKCNEDAKKLLNNSTVKKIGEECLIDAETVVKTFETSLLDLRLFGFEELADLAIELSKKDPYLGYYILNAYDSYFIRPFVDGLFGYIHYDYNEIRAMSLLKVVTSVSDEYLEQVLYSSPASYSIIVKHPIKINTIKPSRKGLKILIENRERKALNKCASDLKNTINNGDLNKIPNLNEKLGGIVEEDINNEVRNLYRTEKIVNNSLTVGSCLIENSPIAINNLSETVGNNPGIGILIEIGAKALADHIRMEDPKSIVESLPRKWLLTGCGLPFVLWEYDVKPKGRP